MFIINIKFKKGLSAQEVFADFPDVKEGEKVVFRKIPENQREDERIYDKTFIVDSIATHVVASADSKFKSKTLVFDKHISISELGASPSHFKPEFNDCFINH